MSKTINFGVNRCLIGIAGDWNSNVGYINSTEFLYGDSTGDGAYTDLYVRPRGDTAKGVGCTESIYYNRDKV